MINELRVVIGYLIIGTCLNYGIFALSPLDNWFKAASGVELFFIGITIGSCLMCG